MISAGVFKELWRVPLGRSGIIMLGFLTLVSLIVIVTYPADFGISTWSNPTLWADNPKTAPPVWTNLFTQQKRARHHVFILNEPDEKTSTARATTSLYSVTFDHTAASPPGFLSLSVSDITFDRRAPVIAVNLVRPDGSEILLSRHAVSGPRRSEDPPYKRHDEDALRLALGEDSRTADAARDLFGESYDTSIPEDVPILDVLFGLPGRDGIEVLNGEYRVDITFLTASESDTVSQLKLIVGGSVYGIMGTDALGRDLAVGLMYGLPVALLIGVATSIVSTLIGMSLGLVSGYSGGKTDIIIQRSADIVANVPVLPLLIFLVFIGGSKLWIILTVLVAFSWPGLTIMVRTMVLQLRSGQEVEAARALGASSGRIIFRHVFPHTASYILSQLVFFAPSAILAEAGLSFLGLGDPSIPTWGQILEYGFRTGAVFLGYWWWVIPPGLLIILTAVTFMFLALGLEPIVDPRLKRRRSWHF